MRRFILSLVVGSLLILPASALANSSHQKPPLRCAGAPISDCQL